VSLVVWDTNVLALYFGKRLTAEDELRVEGLLQDMRKRREPIGIPAPVFAEFMAGITSTEKANAVALFSSTAFRFLPYDKKAAIETAMLIGRKVAGRPRQAVKVDRQIIAIAKANGARSILTNDTDMAADARHFGVTAQSIDKLEIPDQLKQHRIEFKEGQDPAE